MARANLVRAELAAGRPARALDLLLQYFHGQEEMDFDRGLVDLLSGAQATPEEGATPASVRERDIAEAAACFRKVAAAGRYAVTEAYIDLGIAQYLDGEYGEAADAFAAAAAHAPSPDELSYPVAVCTLMSAGEIQRPEAEGYGPLVPRMQELLQKARPYLEKAVGVRAVADAARLNLGILHYLLGDYQRAVTVLRPIARADSPWEILNVLAIAQARQARELQRMAQSSPLLGALRRRQIEAEVGRLLSAALHSFTHVLRNQPHNPIAHANIGLAHFLRNRGDDVEQALLHWQSMRQTGGEWGERIFEIFTVAMSEEGAHRLRFHDIEVAFRPLPVEEWITCVPPRMAGLQYVTRELLDLPPPHLEAHHRLVERAIVSRDRAERLRLALQRLTT
jgi:tetratricopeptide (TPR) repeat protein